MDRDSRMPLSFSAQSKKSTVTAERLLTQIRSGDLGAGQRLPSERELAKAYNVSRTVLREALSALQLAGVVEARVGDGNYVTAGGRLRTSRDVLAGIARSVQAGIDLMEMLRVREALDVAIAHLAIENATAAELRALRQLLRVMAAEARRGRYREYLKLTLEFHDLLAKASRSDMLARIEAMLLQKTRGHLWLLVRNYTRARARHSLLTHALIFRGVATRRLAIAVRGIMRHYRDYPSLSPHGAPGGNWSAPNAQALRGRKGRKPR